MKNAFEHITNTEICRLIDEYIHSAKHRDILKDRLVNGMTYEELAESHDYSVRQVKNIVYRYGDRLLLLLQKGKG